MTNIVERAFPYEFQDWSANRGSLRIQLLLFLFRSVSKPNRVSSKKVHLRILRIIYATFSEWLLGIELPSGVKVGRNLRIRHGYGLVVHSDTVLGSGCLLRQGVTLGIRGNGIGDRPPTVGNDVVFGSGSQALGSISIGDGASIGAGAIVLESIPAGLVAVGNPARIL